MTSAFLGAWLVAVLGCPCQPKQLDAKQAVTKVEVTVVVILASERCVYIDPRLKDIATELRKEEPSLTGFTLVSMTKLPLAAEEKGKFACVEDAFVQVVVNNCKDDNNKVCMIVTAPLQNEIKYKTVCGKFLPLVTRYQTKERVPVRWVAVALCEAMAGGPLGPLMACETLDGKRCRDRLILAIRVTPCSGK